MDGRFTFSDITNKYLSMESNEKEKLTNIFEKLNCPMNFYIVKDIYPETDIVIDLLDLDSGSHDKLP